ncbi:hypothetical protein AB1A64_13210 [Ruegeria sp. ANG10]|uniref:hypothetical protein n=1 Tax=Ruegeria sp. ANG10 TaxID=3042467 RepID=UPI0034518A68
MKITYSSVRHPVWADAKKSTINCLVKFDHMKGEVPFTANPVDPEPYGREIFQKCASGKCGPVAEYEPNIQNADNSIWSTSEDPTFENWPEILQFVQEANRENSCGTERGQVLVWSSMIETLVFRLLQSFFVEHSLSKEVIDSKDMTFSTAIDLSFCLGLINKKEHRACSNVRTIRNYVAHSWELSLKSRKVQSAIKSLYDANHSTQFEWIDEAEYLIKIVYAGSCGILAMSLANRIESAASQRRLTLE